MPKSGAAPFVAECHRIQNAAGSSPKDPNADEDIPFLDDDVFGELRGAVRIELYDRSLIARTPQHVSQVLIHRSVASVSDADADIEVSFTIGA